MEFARIAMAGKTPCRQLLPKFDEKFQSAEVRYFLPDQKEEALKWVMDKNNLVEKLHQEHILQKSHHKYEAG